MNDTTTETLTTLLARWAELEPERCTFIEAHKGIHNDLYNFPRLDWSVDIKDLGPEGHFSDPDKNCDLACIQGAVQEAIQARGWSWDMRHNQYGGVGFEATVWDMGPEYHCIGQSPAAALLSAYLKALEAEAE